MSFESAEAWRRKNETRDINAALEAEVMNEILNNPIYREAALNELRAKNENSLESVDTSQSNRRLIPSAENAGIQTNKAVAATQQGIQRVAPTATETQLAQLAANKASYGQEELSAPYIGRQQRAEAQTATTEAQSKQRLTPSKESATKAGYEELEAEAVEGKKTAKAKGFVKRLQLENDAFKENNRTLILRRDQLAQRLGVEKDTQDFRTFMTQLQQKGIKDAEKIKAAWRIFEKAREVGEVSTIAEKFSMPIRQAQKMWMKARTEGWLQTKDSDKRMEYMIKLDKLDNPQLYSKAEPVNIDEI